MICDDGGKVATAVGATFCAVQIGYQGADPGQFVLPAIKRRSKRKKIAVQGVC